MQTKKNIPLITHTLFYTDSWTLHTTLATLHTLLYTQCSRSFYWSLPFWQLAVLPLPTRTLPRRRNANSKLLPQWQLFPSLSPWCLQSCLHQLPLLLRLLLVKAKLEERAAVAALRPSWPRNPIRRRTEDTDCTKPTLDECKFVKEYYYYYS